VVLVPTRAEVPPQLLTRPFTVAEARALGVTPDVLRGRRFRAPFRGVRVAAELPDDLVTLCRAASLVLPPDARFRGVTAAWMHGVPLPRDVVSTPLDVATSRRGLAISGVRVWVEASPGPCCRVGGVAVSTAPWAWAELAGSLRTDDLVVAGDHLLRRGLARVSSLAAVVDARAARRGVRRLRAALALLEGRSDSPMETRLRLLLVRAGLPTPCVNRDVVEDGVWLARPDLSYPEQRIAIEYEGDHHRTDRRQWKSDKTRRRLLEDHGWLVIEVIDDDVYKTPELTVARVRTALAARS
jgi:very-short-patch-repair endonuclease